MKESERKSKAESSAVSHIAHFCTYTYTILSTQCEYSDAALKMVKTLRVERWTLLALNSRHLFLAEATGPPTYFQTCENGGQGSCSSCN